MNTEKEVTQGKAAADACKAAGVEHVVWSSLIDTESSTDEIKPINGFKVPHFAGKP